MNILVACEESQAVTIELRKLGHNAFSCDVMECSGGHPEWHIQQDVLPLLNGKCSFQTQDIVDGMESIYPNHMIKGKWDMIIAFPPCTLLTWAGTRHFSRRINPEEKVAAREAEREKAAEFFMACANADCEKIVMENPRGYMSNYWRKQDQVIQPYYFAKSVKDELNYFMKTTCLWLKGVKPLTYGCVLPKPEPMYICKGEKCKGKKIHWCEAMKTGKGKGTQAERAKARSKTFPGIAKAMAIQFTELN